jgi:threonine/homoserine/homoserine lactone efflux protein
MDAGFFLRGFIIGFSIAAPVGPIGVLCIRRTLTQGRAAGFVSGLGAATADAAYGGVAGFGLTAISGVLIGQQRLLRLIGGLFLLYLGARTLAAGPASTAGPAGSGRPVEETDHRGLLGAYASTLVLTLTNPLTILTFAAIFAGLGLAAAPAEYGSAALLVSGVFLGSGTWWFILSGGAAVLRDRLRPGGLRWISRISGGIILAFGLIALASLLLP